MLRSRSPKFWKGWSRTFYPQLRNRGWNELMDLFYKNQAVVTGLVSMWTVSFNYSGIMPKNAGPAVGPAHQLLRRFLATHA